MFIVGAASSSVDSRILFLSRVYSLIGVSCLVAGASAYFAMGVPFFYQHPWVMLGLLIGSIFIVQRFNRSALAVPALFGFAALSGASISPLVAIASSSAPAILIEALLITAVLFFVISYYAFVSKRDLSEMSSFLMVGLVAVIATSLVNIFILESSLLHMAVSGVSVVLFSGFLLYDTNNVIKNYSNDDYVAAALTIYIDLFLLFQNVLNLLIMLSSADD